MRYQLVDFGDGRKLESLGDYLIDRPSPAASHARRALPGRWDHVDATYDSQQRSWCFQNPFPPDLQVDCGGFVMPVRATPFGHLGVFPEQLSNWDWLQATGPHLLSSMPLNALNLFGYTGASTTALAIAGFHVAHVDAAKPNVDAARDAAHLNQLDQAPIRYLIDDAAKFTAREVRRNRDYHTIVLDPPAYGHSPKGHTWRLERDLWPLMEDCLRLIGKHLAAHDSRNHPRMLITGHSPSVGIEEVERYLLGNSIVNATSVRLESKRSGLKDLSGRRFDTGFQVRATFV